MSFSFPLAGTIIPDTKKKKGPHENSNSVLENQMQDVAALLRFYLGNLEDRGLLGTDISIMESVLVKKKINF